MFWIIDCRVLNFHGRTFLLLFSWIPQAVEPGRSSLVRAGFDVRWGIPLYAVWFIWLPFLLSDAALCISG